MTMNMTGLLENDNDSDNRNDHGLQILRRTQWQVLNAVSDDRRIESDEGDGGGADLVHPARL